MRLRNLAGLALVLALPAMPAAAGGHAHGTRVTWRPAFPQQGDPLLVSVRPRSGRAPQGGSFLGRPLRFFPWGKGEWRALVPVPVKARPGKATLTVKLAGPGDRTATRRVTVRAGAFETERLRVNPRFTRPPRRARRRIKGDHRAIRRAWASRSEVRLWRAPFVTPLEGRTTDPFGVKRTFNGRVRSRHLGWDIDGHTGDPVKAAAAGRVVLAKRLFYSGNTVILDHGLGLYTVYFHLSRMAVAEGDTVDAGDLVGKVGATGRATGPHLHFGVKLEGRYVSPQRLLDLGMGTDPAAADVAEAGR
jgi:murein DD-endopeptidase MepM/ murein hydrolase activator NlpD